VVVVVVVVQELINTYHRIMVQVNTQVTVQWKVGVEDETHDFPQRFSH
jgi:hypothetical protein